MSSPSSLPPLTPGRPRRRRLRTFVRRGIDWDGREIDVVLREQQVESQPDGTLVDRTTLGPEGRGYLHCGHPLPSAGRCGVAILERVPGRVSRWRACGRQECAGCFGRCARCGCPQCLEHILWFTDEAGGLHRLCWRCQPAVEQLLASREPVILPFDAAPRLAPPKEVGPNAPARPTRRAGPAQPGAVGAGQERPR